jgi:ubiquinone/menaquinone biosynthesis C-methylase UbiE
MNSRLMFYKQVVEKIIIDKNASVLVVAGALSDKEVFESLNLSNVTISNIDSRLNGSEFIPYKWSFQDAQNITFEDNSFDYVVIHAALHHCSSPHRALLEMHRIARREIIAFESRDSFIMKVLEILNISQTFEHAAVYDNDGRFGGVNNTDIPNFVFRWTERELEKTINAFSPIAKNVFTYWYANDSPRANELMRNHWINSLLLAVLLPIYKVFAFFFPKQQNLFAFSIKKHDEKTTLHPWLMRNDGKIVFNMKWAKSKYK